MKGRCSPCTSQAKHLNSHLIAEKKTNHGKFVGSYISTWVFKRRRIGTIEDVHWQVLSSFVDERGGRRVTGPREKKC